MSPRALALAALLAAPALLALGPAEAQLPANPLAGNYLVHRNADVEAKLKAVEAEHPEFATVASAGTTALGQSLWMVTLRHPDAEPRYQVYLDGGHHGNEYMGVELVMACVGRLVEGYAAGDPQVLAFLEEHEVRALPLVNPEGNAADTRKNSRQVDLNRNYPYEWGGEGSGGSPAAPNYRGPGALSEPETQANARAATSFGADVWVSMHTGIAEMYWPWSYTDEPPPDDAMFRSLEQPFEEASHGRLDAMQSAELYLAAGSLEDTAYGAFGVPGFIIEVHEDQFVPAYPGTIPPEVAEQLDGLAWLLAHTKHLGANVAVRGFAAGPAGATATLANEGWGPAQGLVLTLRRGAEELATRTLDLAPGAEATVVFEGAAGGGLVLEGRYPRLLVPSSPVWSFTAPLPGDAGPEPTARTPGPAAAASVGALAAGALARRP